MYTIYLSVVLGALLCPLIIRLVGKRAWETSCGLYGNALIGALIGGAIGFILALIIMPHFVPLHIVRDTPIELAAVRSSDGASDVYLRGIGSSNRSMQYSFFVKNDDGSVSPDSVPAMRWVHIIEDENIKDRGTIVVSNREFDLSSPVASWALALTNGYRFVSEEIRVPKGSVVLTFTAK
jgi:hypothetical protein